MGRYVEFAGHWREGGNFDREKFDDFMSDLTKVVSNQDSIPKYLVVILVNMPLDLEAPEWLSEGERSERERALADYLGWIDDLFNVAE